MFGRETFIVRIAEDAMAPRVRACDYVWIDPDVPGGARQPGGGARPWAWWGDCRQAPRRA